MSRVFILARLRVFARDAVIDSRGRAALCIQCTAITRVICTPGNKLCTYLVFNGFTGSRRVSRQQSKLSSAYRDSVTRIECENREKSSIIFSRNLSQSEKNRFALDQNIYVVSWNVVLIMRTCCWSFCKTRETSIIDSGKPANSLKSR